MQPKTQHIIHWAELDCQVDWHLWPVIEITNLKDGFFYSVFVKISFVCSLHSPHVYFIIYAIAVWLLKCGRVIGLGKSLNMYNDNCFPINCMHNGLIVSSPIFINSHIIPFLQNNSSGICTSCIRFVLSIFDLWLSTFVIYGWLWQILSSGVFSWLWIHIFYLSIHIQVQPIKSIYATSAKGHSCFEQP